MSNNFGARIKNPYQNNIMLTILAIIFMNLSFGFCASIHENTQSIETNVCKTPVCLEAAESMLETMNTTHKPCDNFYLFACGTFVKHAPVPRGEPIVTTHTIIQNEVKELLRDDLENNITDDEPRTFQLLKSYYNVCLDSRSKEAIEEQKNLAFSIFKTLGGWPLLEGDTWDETKFDWKNFTYNIRKLGFIDTKIFISLSKSTSKIKIEGPLTLELNDDTNDTMLDILKYFGADDSEAIKVLQDLYDFQMKLSEVGKIQSTKQSNKHLLDRLSKKHNFTWNEYLSKFLRETIELDSKTIVSINLTSFDQLLKVLENTDKRIVANHAFLSLAMELYEILENRVSNIKQEHYVAPNTGHKLWKYCMGYLLEHMPIATGALYVRKHFDKSWKIDAQKLMENLVKTFQSFVEKSKSISNDTKEAIISKTNALHINTAYPDELLVDEKIDGYFKNLDESSGNFLENHLALLRFEYDKNIRQVEDQIKHKNEYNWVKHGGVAVPFAEYDYKSNIDISASLIHKKLFHPEKPNYLNFAGIGRLMSHEMGHSIDAVARKFHKDWDKEDMKKANTDEKCLLEQYASYNASKRAIPINGLVTLNENIADLAGLKWAYTAYENWMKENGEELGLPGLPFTPRQLFWLNFAHTQCHRIRRNGWDDMLGNDEHTPGPFRVIVPLSNIPEFARDFNCKDGSRMNPTSKCTFWWDRT